MRPHSLAVVAFAVTLVHTTHSLATSDTRTDNISLPASVRSFNGSLGDVRAKLLVGADKGATGEARMLNMARDLDIRKQVHDTLRLLHEENNLPGVNEVPQLFDQQAVASHLSMKDETLKEKVQRLNDIAKSAQEDWNRITDRVEAARYEWIKVKEDQELRYTRMQQCDLHPVELMKMVFFDVKIRAASFYKIDASGNFIAAVLPTPFVAPQFKFLEKYIVAYNLKHNTAFTLAGTLFDLFMDARSTASFLSMVKSNTFVEASAEDVSATEDLLVDEWLQRVKMVTDSKSQEGLLKHQNMYTTIEYTLELALHIPSKRQEIVDGLVKEFGIRRAEVLLKEMVRICENWIAKGVTPKIYNLIPPFKEFAAASIKEIENQTPELLEKSDAANLSPSVRRVPVLHDFFVR
uniref:RxLR effector candidate protein n=1 Tax=Hyaloperonospora arabidopsidis (strain Emoy2) TaxID=559515 RepID=M4B4D3_HYAAE